MNDLLLIISVALGTYLCSMGFAMLLIRLIFPFKTKEELERINVIQALAKQQPAPKQQPVSLALLNKSGQFA